MFKNNTKAFLIFCVLGSAVILTGCEQTPDCTTAVAEAANLGSQGELASFDEERFDATCRADYLAAWEAARKAFCDPELAFARAMEGRDQPMACDQPAYSRNHQLGINLYALSEEKNAIEAALARAEADGTSAQELQASRMRLRVLEREIPELETIARMRGLMAPAELPPQVREAPEERQ